MKYTINSNETFFEIDLLDFISKYELYDEKIYNIIKLCIERKLNDDKLKIKTKDSK